MVDSGSRRPLADDGHDGPGDEVPVLGQPDRNHGLDVQNVERRVPRPQAEVEVALERDADEVRHRILRLLGELGLDLPGGRLGGLLRPERAREEHRDDRNDEQGRRETSRHDLHPLRFRYAGGQALTQPTYCRVQAVKPGPAA